MTFLLDTYDPDWEARWERANARCEALRATLGTGLKLTVAQSTARTAEMEVAARTLQNAFDAQFRTVNHYRDHWLKWFSASHDGEQPATTVPDGLTMPELRTHLDRLSATAWLAVRKRDRPAPQDPPGLGAFRTPAGANVQRHVERLELDIPEHGRSVRCLLAAEVTRPAAHVCFIWVKDGGSPCNDIEGLANHACRTLLSCRRGWRGLLGLRVPGQFRPGDVAFYEYDPIWASEWSKDAFSRVEMRWDGHKGFTDPSWHSYPSIPAWLVEVADNPLSRLIGSVPPSVWPPSPRS